MHGFEIELDETTDKLNKATETFEEKDKLHKEVESDIAALTRRIMLMEEEAKKSETTLANTVTKLALTSKSADEVLKKVNQCFLMRCDLFSRNLQPSSWMSQNYFHAYVLPPPQIRPTVIREACPRPLPKWMKNILTMIAGESCGKQVPEQRGDLGGVGQEPEADDKNGFRQRAEAG